MHRQQHDRQRRDWSYEQQPAHLATAPTPLLGAAVDSVTEEGELPPEPHQHNVAYDSSDPNAAYQWQVQQQYGAYPSELNQQQYADAYQQAQYNSYNQPQQPQPGELQQQHRQASGAAGAHAYEEKGFNACDTFFGPWPGFCFKLVSASLQSISAASHLRLCQRPLDQCTLNLSCMYVQSLHDVLCCFPSAPDVLVDAHA